VKIRTRILLGFLVIVVAGFAYLLNWALKDLRPHYLKSMEESLVDTATLLSSLVACRAGGDTLAVADLRTAFEDAAGRELSARIYDLVKTRMSIDVYVTDTAGIVVFDSRDGRAEGKDYSRWNDVRRTLAGSYGARATRIARRDEHTTVLYVASPIRRHGRTVGVLTVAKPIGSVARFIKTARHDVLLAGLLALLMVLGVGTLLSSLVTSPIRDLTAYARAVRDGRKAHRPRFRSLLGRSELDVMGDAFEDMRRTLEGKQYVERYVQTLTHEIKSPVSAIRGAAELMGEDMDKEGRAKFLSNIRTEADRIRDIVDRLLQLSAVENRSELRDVEDIDLGELVESVLSSMRPVRERKDIRLLLEATTGIRVACERFLVRQAVTNLVQNALAFSPASSEVTVTVRGSIDSASVVVEDDGPGIPAFAREKIFDRFYSLNRPDTGRKSTGLGLSFVREVAELHGGRVSVTNRAEGGARAELSLPVRG
jgi:two-component system sensor histidine kinase CreC